VEAALDLFPSAEMWTPPQMNSAEERDIANENEADGF
jgi:hypothetical protein